jgi:hypothetical protein
MTIPGFTAEAALEMLGARSRLYWARGQHGNVVHGVFPQHCSAQPSFCDPGDHVYWDSWVCDDPGNPGGVIYLLYDVGSC